MKRPVYIALFLIMTFGRHTASGQTWAYYDSLRSIHLAKHEFDSAHFYAGEALKSVEREMGKGTITYADMLQGLFFVNYQRGDFRAALEVSEREYEVRQSSGGASHPNYGSCLNNMALALTELGEYRRALPLFLEALEHASQTEGKEHSLYGSRLNNLAGLYKRMGYYEKALPYYIEALEITGRTMGTDHPSYGVRLNNLATLYSDMVQYDQALPLYLASLEIAKNSVGTNHPHYSARLNNLAVLYRRIGQHEKALSLLLESLSIHEQRVGKDHPGYITNLSNLAGQYRVMGEYDKALELYLEALNKTRQVFGTLHPDYGTRLNNLAAVYRLRKEYDKALPLLIEAIENTELSFGKDHFHYGVRLSNLAALYQDMGEYGLALPIALNALDNAAKTFGDDHPHYASYLLILANIYNQTGRSENALPLYRKALHINLNSIQKAFTFLSEREKEQFVHSLSNNLNTYSSFFVDFARYDPEVAAAAYDVELATKGMILQSGINMRRSILNSGNLEALQVYDDWVAIRSELSRQYSTPLAERRTDLKGLEIEAEILEGELSRMSGSFQQSRTLGATMWRDIQKKLADNEVVVEFSSVRYMKDRKFSGQVIYTALVLRPGDSHPTLVFLCSQEQLDSLLDNPAMDEFSLVNTLYMGIGYGLGINEFNEEYGERLNRLIWQPIEYLIPKGSTVYFSPSGSLHQVTLAALPYNHSKRLSDVYNFRQLSTTAMILTAANNLSPDNGNAVLFGGVNYEMSHDDRLSAVHISGLETPHMSRSLPENIERGGITWPYLPGTLEEVKRVADILENSNFTVQLFVGNEALEERMKSLSGQNSPDILHIATHGFYFPSSDDPDKGSDSEPISGNSLFQMSNNPLYRSGLLFAGANHSWRDGTGTSTLEDGILTAYEVSCLTLMNTRLVVLSACETGLGDIRGSEGVFGLQRAFKAAGAEHILMSLWKVPDYETALFMHHFYSNYFLYDDIFDAFSKTQNHMKTLYPDEPYKWAAFVLIK